MTNTPCACRVPLTQIRDTLGRTGLDPAAIEAAGHTIAPDWRGEPSLTVADAATYVAVQRESHERQRAADRQRIADREAAEKAQRDREREVYEAAHEAARKAGKSAGAGHADGLEAIQQMREQPSTFTRLARRLTTGKDAA